MSSCLVEYITHSGSDLTVVNAARASFSKSKDNLDSSDKSLLNYLARGISSQEWKDAKNLDPWHLKNIPTHWAPFAHPHITVRETIPLSIARQRFKHTVGWVYSEQSRRYITEGLSIHIPSAWRSKPENAKQGSGPVIKDDQLIQQVYLEAIDKACKAYETLLLAGVAPEQARFVLPQGMKVTYVTTGSLYAFANAYIQRSDPHAQKEIQDLASEWDKLLSKLFPLSWAALTTGDCSNVEI